MKTTHIPRSACPPCGYEMDTASPAGGGGAIPEEGDFTMCINCGATLRFNADLTLRSATLADIETLDPEAAMQLGKARGFIEKRGRIRENGERLRSPSEPASPPGYEEGAEMTYEIVGRFLEEAVSGPPEFGMPGPEVALIASISDVLGTNLPRNAAARKLLHELMAESKRRNLDYPTVMMLRMSLEMHGVPITVVPLGELGIHGTVISTGTRGGGGGN